MTRKRARYSAAFKAKVALRDELPTAQLAAKHGIHQTTAGEWQRQAMEGLRAVFSGKAAAQLRAAKRIKAKAVEADGETLHAKIGQLMVEHDCLANVSGR